MSSNSLTSSPTMRNSPPQSGQVSPGSSSRRSRGVLADTRGRRRDFLASSLSSGGGASVSLSSCGVSSASAMATLQVLERQFALFDLALDLFRALSEGLLLQLRNPHPQRLDQQIMGTQGGRDLLVFGLQGHDHRLQNRGIIRQTRCGGRHARVYHAPPGIAMKTRKNRRINQPPRAGGAPQFGRRQSIPSHSIASCAGVSRTLPSVAVGHGNRPRSRTL
jgi:hypothetical protein